MNPTTPPTRRFPNANNVLPSAFGTRVKIVPAATIPPESIKWLWHAWLAAGKLHMLAGQPAAGKTGTAVFIAATISRGDSGGRWPDGTEAPPGNVVFWTCEDGLADTIIPRLIAAGANMERVFVLTGTEENGHQRAFNPAKDLERLMQRVAEIGNVSLIIIDPILQVVGGDSHKNAEVRRALEPLVTFAEDHGIAILGITHVNKRSKGKDLIDRITGSLAFTAVARIVILAVKGAKTEGNDAPNSCVLVRAKSNIGPIEGGFAYQTKTHQFEFYGEQFETSILVWNPIRLEGTPETILRNVESDAGDYVENTNALATACSFLKGLLAKGGLPYPTILDLANNLEPPISAASLKRAKIQLGVMSFKRPAVSSQKPCHYWYLAPALSDQDDSLIMRTSHAPMEVKSAFDQVINPLQGGNFWGGIESTAPPNAFAAPHAPHAQVEPVEPVDQPKWDAGLESALQLAVEQARNQLGRLEIDPGEEAIEDAIFGLENDYTDGLIDDPDKLALLRSRLRSTNWWQGIPLRRK